MAGGYYSKYMNTAIFDLSSIFRLYEFPFLHKLRKIIDKYSKGVIVTSNKIYKKTFFWSFMTVFKAPVV